ncbi:MAG: AAA family ATPase [Pseudomonadota bacterium]
MMRLRRLDLTRFGHFTNRSIDLGPAGPCDFHIIHGPNEAGKTTLMEAYLRLIYGFPPRDGYGFKHPLNTLQVGGLVEIDGKPTELVRVKRPANSLLDGHGDVIPEAVLQHCLGGIAQDDYRKLFCLDDATIEAGGDEITNSKGDIGRLLFSAAAGIGNLTGVLDQVAFRADAFYKKGGSKSTFAGLKRDLETLTSEIKAHDIPASQYKTLRSAVEAARLAETGARAAREALDRRMAQAAALCAAHPIAADLHAAELALDPLRHYPAALDIDPEGLVALMTARVAHEAARDTQAGLQAAATRDRDALTLRPDVLALADQITALDALRGRMDGALADLPVRQADRAEALADMAARLADLGLDPGDDPTRFILPEHRLRGLDRALDALRAAEATLASARSEARLARIAQGAATAALAAAEARVTIGPDLPDLLTRCDAAACVEANRAARQRIELARSTAATRLRDLSRGDVVFPALPPVPLSLRQAEDLAAQTLAAGQQVTTLHSARESTAGKLARAESRLAVLTAVPDLVTDDMALSLRADRNSRWAAHRAALDATSADAFASALQRDDAASALRQAQTREIADLQQARLALAEAVADDQFALTALTAATTARTGLDSLRAQHLASLGLPASLTAADLADWRRQHDAARAAQEAVDQALDQTAPARRAADQLRAGLAALPGLAPEAGDAGGDLDALFRLATARLATRQTQIAEVQRARDALTRDATAHDLRQTALADAETARSAAQTDWDAQAAAALPPGTAMANLRDALPALRGLQVLDETVAGLSRQIAGMIRDSDAFASLVSPVAQALGLGDLPAAALHDRARLLLAEARTAAARDADLARAQEGAGQAHAEALTRLATQDMQIRQLAEMFDPAIATGTLADLRQAVMTGQTAIGLRARIGQLTTALTTRLGTPSRDAARDLLARNPLDQAEATLIGLTDDLPRLTQGLEDAIIARTRAEAALDQVQGDADIARRVAQARTTEVAMQDGALRYLEDRFAHLLADRAIRRYRDAHRSGMMVATEAAFGTLTNGAYATLSTRTEGQSEALVAIQSAGGGAKQARDMSKGTRFQLYLALRAAAHAQVAAGGTVLPFFCDDIFETFDEGRTTAACGLLARIGRSGQAIYLTHHRHVVDLARKLCGADVTVHHLAE